jgi:ferric-dicitrate binding protein FerR (iron transport regulator)
VSHPDPSESIAVSLAALARDEQERQGVDDAAGRARLLVRAAFGSRGACSFHPPPRGACSFHPGWFALPAFAAGCALLVWGLFPMPSSLRYQVSGASQTGSYVSAPAGHSVAIDFSDQTRVVLAPTSQLRVQATSPRGAHLLLERGTAVVHVVHRDNADWTFAAGPFDVHVPGTRFELRWEPAPQVFELTLHEGSVVIQSPLSVAPLALRAGQTFRGDLPHHTLTTTEVRSQRPSAAACSPERARACDRALTDGTR